MFFSWPIAWVELFLLVVFRVAGVIALMPVLGGRGMPARAKLLLALLITLLLLPALPVADWPLGGRGLWSWLGLAAHEVLLGVLLGFAAQVPILAMQMAGELLGLQMGFGIASVIDPESGGQENIMAGMLRNVALLLFLVFNGHHVVLTAMADSLRTLPPGALSLSPDLLGEGLRLVGHLFELGLRLGAPAMAALLLSEVGLGLIARTVPQMNIFIVGFPLKIGLGFALLGITLPSVLVLFRQEVGALAGVLARLAAP
ncbi:MAG: flagellar biosynthetic protein FliR [bacterium]|jgi:flagellar biosynthetic protein FliR|nr:flagellar biosynthetic protein FliR [bacterium]